MLGLFILSLSFNISVNILLNSFVLKQNYEVHSKIMKFISFLLLLYFVSAHTLQKDC